MKVYQATSASSDVYRERTGDFRNWVASSADFAPAMQTTGTGVNVAQLPINTAVQPATAVKVVTYAILARD